MKQFFELSTGKTFWSSVNVCQNTEKKKCKDRVKEKIKEINMSMYLQKTTVYMLLGLSLSLQENPQQYNWYIKK